MRPENEKGQRWHAALQNNGKSLGATLGIVARWTPAELVALESEFGQWIVRRTIADIIAAPEDVRAGYDDVSMLRALVKLRWQAAKLRKAA